MGDLIEITTWPKHQNSFYLVTGNGITFEAKAIGTAVLGLSRKPSHNVEYWIGIGDNNRCWIRKDPEHSQSASVQNILSSDHFTGFWLLWSGPTIKLGRLGEKKPIVEYPNTVTDLKYVTFSSRQGLHPVHWRFDLAPVRPKRDFKPLSKGKLTWVEAGNQLPDGALIGGFENEVQYIIRAQHRLSLTPGKFVPSEGVGYVSWGGGAHPKVEFEVLCGFDCTWEKTCEDQIPVGAVVGGYSEDHQERLYIGRAVHNGHVIPGKVQPSHKCCYIAYNGREIAKKTYQILVEPNMVQRSVNSTFLSDIHIDSAYSDEDDEHDSNDDNDENDDNDDNDDYGHLMNEVMVL